MLRGSFCQTEFTALMVVGIFLIVALKAVTLIINFRAVRKQETILPTSYDTGSSTGIQRSLSDASLSKRYMTAREPYIPSIRSSPPTPSTPVAAFFSNEDIALRMPHLSP